MPLNDTVIADRGRHIVTVERADGKFAASVVVGRVNLLSQ